MNKFITTLFFSIVFPLTVYAQDYPLGADDVVMITVHEHPDLETRARVGEGGNINFPLIGTIKMGGLSTKEAELVIEDMLKNGNYIKSPQVTVFLEEFKSKSVSVLGKINKPGKYPIRENSTVFDVIADAGGISKDGNSRVHIKRKGKETIVVDTVAELESNNISNDIKVLNEDIVFVPRMDVFYIYGEVKKPGEYQLHSNMTIMQALSVGGGLTDKGTERGLKIKRKKSTGEVEVINADILDVLYPDDVVFVKESLF
jgi:polysaccharide export outer membrane protein